MLAGLGVPCVWMNMLRFCWCTLPATIRNICRSLGLHTRVLIEQQGLRDPYLDLQQLTETYSSTELAVSATAGQVATVLLVPSES